MGPCEGLVAAKGRGRRTTDANRNMGIRWIAPCKALPWTHSPALLSLSPRLSVVHLWVILYCMCVILYFIYFITSKKIML